MSKPIIEVNQLSKIYANGFTALNEVSLKINQGEIFALLGPNGAGKTTLINIICGLVNASSGNVSIAGYDYIKQYRQARALIGLVPQEIGAETFENVLNSVNFSRGLFAKTKNPALVEKILKELSLWDKRYSPQITLSGGMKRRVLIAKALAHEPSILFLDEPTAGVDVSLRQDMWALVKRLRAQGVTVILTTHYIEEAEEMADRVGIIQNGELLLVETKHKLMQTLGEKKLQLHLDRPYHHLPESLSQLGLTLSDDGKTLQYHYAKDYSDISVVDLIQVVQQSGLVINDVDTHRSSLEDIFVSLMEKKT